MAGSLARMPAAARILFCGDLVGSAGRHALLSLLPTLRQRHSPTFVVVNAENVAGGFGITPKLADELLGAGVDVITLGNHSYRHREIYPYLDEHHEVLRPANYLRGQPGQGHTIVERGGVRLAVISLSGSLFMRTGRSAFSEIGALLAELRGQADHILVDMHAEATSEKVAMGWHLDGRVTAVVGTAYITDVGMTGSRAGVLGFQRELAIEALVTQMPTRLLPAEGDPWLMGVLVSCSEPLRADAIDQLLIASE